MYNLTLVSATMSLLIVFVLGFKFFSKKSYKNSSYYIIWILISLRLIFFLDISITDSSILNSIPLKLERIPSKVGDISIAKEKQNINLGKKDSPNTSIDENISPSYLSREIKNYLPLIWASGFFVYLLGHLLSYYIFKSSLKKSLISADGYVFRKLEAAKKQLDINFPVQFGISDQIGSPLLIGVFKPTLILSSSSLIKKDLDYIIYHELVHLKRHDLEFKLMFFLAKSLHWFNPLVHLMVRSAYEDIEISCDKKVVDYLGENTRVAYSKALLNNICLEKSPILSTNYGGGKKMMKKRIDSLLEKKHFHPGHKLIILAVFSILASSFLLGGCQRSTPDISKPDKEIYSLKSKYIGDNSKVSTIVSRVFEKGYAKDHIELDTDSKPYGLKVFFKEEFKGENTLNRESAMLFSLIENLDYIEYNDSKGLRKSLTRENSDDFTLDTFGKTTKELGLSQKNFNLLENFDPKENLNTIDDYLAYKDLEKQLVYDVYYNKDEAGFDSENTANLFISISVDLIDSFPSENKDSLEIYAFVKKSLNSIDENKHIKEVSGYLVPVYMKFSKEKTGYKLVESLEPKDGSYYGPSVKAMAKNRTDIESKILSYKNSHSILSDNRDRIEIILKNNKIDDYTLDKYL